MWWSEWQDLMSPEEKVFWEEWDKYDSFPQAIYPDGHRRELYKNLKAHFKPQVERKVLEELHQLAFDADGPGGPVYDEITRLLKDLK